MNGAGTLADLFIQHGCAIEIPLNSRFFLHDQEQMIWIEKGDVDIFGLDPDRHSIEILNNHFGEIAKRTDPFFGDQFKGGLHFLTNHGEGSILLNFDEIYRSGKPLMIAIANRETRVWKLSIEKVRDLLTSCPQLNQQMDLQIEQWMHGFSSLFLYRKTPTLLLPIEYDVMIHLQSDTQAVLKRGEEKKIGWIDLVEGKIEIAGLQTLTLKPADSLYPLCQSIWFQSSIASILQLKTIHSVLSHPKCLHGLKTFNAHIIDLLFFNKLMKGRKEVNKMRLQDHCDRKTLEGSLNELGTIFNPQERAPPAAVSNRIDSCCQVIGQHLNLTFTSLPFNEEQRFFSFEDYLYRLCQSSKIEYRRVSLMENWWKHDHGPLLCFNRQHFLPLALIPLFDGGYEVYHPEHNILTPFKAEEYPDLDPSAYVFYRSLPNKNEISNSMIASFCIFAKKWNCIAFAFFSFLAVAILSISPSFTQKLYAVVVPNLNYVLFAQIGFGFFLLSLCVLVFSFCREYLVIRLMTLFDQDLSAALWQRMLTLPVDFFRKYKVGDLFVRIQIVNVLRDVLSGQKMRQLVSVFFSFLYLIPMFYYNPLLALIGMSVLIPVTLIFIVVSWHLKRLSGLSLEQNGILSGKILETLLGINTIRTYGCENRFFARWEKTFFQSKQTVWRIKTLQSVVNVTYGLVNPISLTVIYGFIIYQMLSSPQKAMEIQSAGFVGVGNFMGFYIAFTALTGVLLNSCDSLLVLARIAPAWNRARIFFDQHPESSSSRFKVGPLTGEVRVDHLHFRYEAESPFILNNISIKIHPGEFIAIVGYSGCGKSTLIRNLIGFENPESGAIYYNGRDLATLDLCDLRRQIGIVLQNSSLIDGSLRDNVMAGAFYSEDQVIKALSSAGFAKDLAELPMGLETVLMNGGLTLSGGQKQKILIARALIAHPKILIFDEASSALDSETQEMVIKNLEALNTTRIAIAHRLSTIRNADRIYVMDDGKIVDEGTYKELAVREGLFRTLLKRQSRK